MYASGGGVAIRIVNKRLLLGEIPTPGNTNTTALGGPNKKMLYAIQTRPRRENTGQLSLALSPDRQ